MKSFIIKTFSLLLLISFSILILNFIKKPTVRCITNSLSLDAKLYDIKNHNFSQVKNIVLGSLMSLNNINGKSFTNNTGLSDFYNFSAWGLSICDVFNLLQIYNKLYSPKNIFIFSNTMDFASKGPLFTNLKLKLIESYLNPKFSFFDIPVILFYSYPFCKDNIYQFNDSQTYSDRYESLKYDFSGSVPLEVYNENKRTERINQRISQYIPTEYQYSKLEEICRFCKKNNINLYFIQTPFSSKFLIDQQDINIYKKHVIKCENICNTNEAIYLNINDLINLDDEDFADSTHLNIKNADLFIHSLKLNIKKEINND